MSNETEVITGGNVAEEHSAYDGLKLDVATMERRVVHYPKELQDPVLWLATYAHQECGRDIKILCDRAKELGYEHDETTWSKVLRGRWNRNAALQPIGPIVKLEKILKAIAALRADEQLKEKAGKVPFVMTSRAETIFNFIDDLRAPDRVNKFGIIVGRTGTEKSATTKEYCRLHNHLTCIHQESPAKPSFSQFIDDLVDKYNGSRLMSQGRKLNKIFESINKRRTIILENVQRLYVEKAAADQPVFNFLQKLQDQSECTVILTITPVFADTLTRKLANGYFEQFIGRAGGIGEFLRLPDYASDDDVELIAKSFGLKNLSEKISWGSAPGFAGGSAAASEKQTRGTALDYLVKISREPGLIRILFGALQKAKVAAERAGEKLNINHVRAERGED